MMINRPPQHGQPFKGISIHSNIDSEINKPRKGVSNYRFSALQPHDVHLPLFCIPLTAAYEQNKPSNARTCQ
jgi:hypothetical protein